MTASYQSHTCFYEPDKENYPYIEDGKAVFVKRCTWQPTKTHMDDKRDEIYNEPMGPQCGHEVTHEFEEAYIRHSSGYKLPLDDGPSEHGGTTREILEEVQQAANRNELLFKDIDDSPEYGRVEVEYGDWTVVYLP